MSLSIEVKKTERPWIVFKETPTYEFELAEGGSALVFVVGLPKRSNGLRHAISSTSTPKRLGWFGNGMHEAFKNPDQPSRWYAAFVSVCKAAEHTLQANSWPIDPSKPIDHYPYLWLSKPVIVLDGQLVSADLDANAELLIADERWCTVRFVYSSEKYRRRMYFVDVVTLNALGDYLVHEAQRNVRHAETLMHLVGLEQQGGLY